MSEPLSQDVARCNGVGSSFEGWRDGCEDCMRRTAKREFGAWTIEPPAIIVFECAFYIAPGEK